GHLVVGGGFGVDDHESGAVFAGDVAQARHRVDGERGADGEEQVAVFSSGDGGVQHVRVETLPEGDRGGFLDAAAGEAAGVGFFVEAGEHVGGGDAPAARQAFHFVDGAMHFEDAFGG